MLSANTTSPAFGCHVEGTIGEFSAPTGKVIFLQTRARLASSDTSPAGRLTSLLAPAREALETSKMDFNQLLQRDLDDYRIAHQLVPYLLKPQLNGPAFFPPILAAVLPFKDRQPVEELPEIVESIETDLQYGGATFKTITSGDYYRLQMLSDSKGKLDQIGSAVFRWNDERVKLVIMDGQHRAMALLAIHRTITNSWSSGASASERYKPFYDAKIRELLKQLDETDSRQRIEGLEFPVTICLFPDETGKGRNPHMAARKIFIDVNKEAKPPSASRLILLSDVRLEHILARELLNHLRTETTGDAFPLFAVEYDNPEPRMTTPRRWNAVTNLEILLKSVDFCCFGPAEIVNNTNQLARTTGKPNFAKKDAYFRNQMGLQDILPSIFEDGPRKIERGDIGTKTFPLYNQEVRKTIIDRFFSLWGQGLLRLFSEIEPYKAHISAIKEIATGWGPSGDVIGALAREALFEGVGLFWILEQGHEEWRDRERDARQMRNTVPAPTDVSKAWTLIDETKRNEFEEARAASYLGKKDPATVQAAKDFYSVAITYAAQVGLALTWASLRNAYPQHKPDDILDWMILGINKALTTGPNASRNRKLIFSKQEKHPLNLLGRLDAPYASYFRVFWLELLFARENEDLFSDDKFSTHEYKKLLEAGRRFYFSKILDDRLAQLRILNPKYSNTKLQSEAQKVTVEALSKSYHHWFGFTKEDANSLVISMLSDTNGEPQIAEDEDSELNAMPENDITDDLEASDSNDQVLP